MAFSGMFSRSKSDKSLNNFGKGARSKIRTNSLSPVRSRNSEPEIISLADQSEKTRRVDKMLGELTLEEKAHIIAKHLNIGSLTYTKPSARDTIKITDNEKEAIIQKYEAAERQGFLLETPNFESDRLTDASAFKQSSLLPPHNTTKTCTRYEISTPSNTNTAPTPWLDFLHLDRAVKNALSARQEFIDMHKEVFANGRQEVPRDTIRDIPSEPREHHLKVTQGYRCDAAQFNDINSDRSHAPPASAAENNTPLAPTTQALSSRISISQALNLIPHFDGNPDNLNLFCVSVRQILTTFGPECEPYVLFALANKLVGRAADGYRARLTSYKSIEKLLTDLTTQYSNAGIADEVSAQIKIASQRPGESAGDFGLRVQKLLNRLLIIYDSAPDYGYNDRESRKREADRDTLEQFMFGLCHPLDHQVRSRHPHTLSEAIRLAVEFESKQSARRAAIQAALPPLDTPGAPQINQHGQTIPVSSSAQESETVTILRALVEAVQGKTCKYCKGTGHTEEVCRKKRFETYRCDYCQRAGHILTECFALKNDARRGRMWRDEGPLNQGRRYNHDERGGGNRYRNDRQQRIDHNRSYQGQGRNYTNNFDNTRPQQRNRWQQCQQDGDQNPNDHLNSQDARRSPQAPSGQAQ